MKHHYLSLKSEKVLMGLFALLFISSAAQVAAILELNSSQPAQTVKAADATSCITIAHPYSKLFSNPFYVGDPKDYEMTVQVQITNGCSRPINIIDPATLNSTNAKTSILNSVSYMGVDYLGPSNNAVAVTMPTNSYNVDPYMEIIGCVDCPLNALQYRVSPIGSSNYQGQSAIRAYNLTQGQTKRFEFTISVGVGHSSDFNWWLRAKPLLFKWFADSAFADNVVNANEINTYNLSSAQKESFATDYLIVSQDGADGSLCTGGMSLGFNDLNEPVCE